MVGREVGDQLAHPCAELEREVRRRRADEGVDIADRGSAIGRKRTYLQSFRARSRAFSWAFCFFTNAVRSFGLRVCRKYAFRCAAICVRYRCTAALRAFFTAAERYCFAAAAGCSGQRDRPTPARAPASAHAAAAAVTVASRMRAAFTADRVAAARASCNPLLGDRAASTLARMRRPVSTELMLLTTVVLWALNITVTRYILTHGFEPLAYATVRYGCATLIFLAIALVAERTLRIRRSDLGLVVLAALCLWLNQLSFVFALEQTSASTIALILGATPIFAALIGLAFGLSGASHAGSGWRPASPSRASGWSRSARPAASPATSAAICSGSRPPRPGPGTRSQSRR